jgi:hypothetical protein
VILKTVPLREFLRSKNVPQARPLPLVHTTESSKLIRILNEKKLLTQPCNIFEGEQLCYLFVGRPAYKYDIEGEASYWTLPSVFVVRFRDPPPFKRIYPFDSGAFSRRRFPDYITTFARDDFEFGPDPSKISTLVSVFFGSELRYWRRQASSEQDFKDKHSLGPLHMQVEALNRLYGDRSASEFDDRAAAVEVQIEQDITLTTADVLGVVVPEDFVRDLHIKSALDGITQHTETYGLHPVSVSMYFGQVYDAVGRIYSKFGILK